MTGGPPSRPTTGCRRRPASTWRRGSRRPRCCSTGATQNHAVPDLLRAATIAEELQHELDREQRGRLDAKVLEAAFTALPAGGVGQPNELVLGRPFTERDVRLGLEATYRSLARSAATKEERIALVDRANAIRPRSLR